MCEYGIVKVDDNLQGKKFVVLWFVALCWCPLQAQNTKDGHALELLNH
jgi:hypothetical protein